MDEGNKYPILVCTFYLLKSLSAKRIAWPGHKIRKIVYVYTPYVVLYAARVASLVHEGGEVYLCTSQALRRVLIFIRCCYLCLLHSPHNKLSSVLGSTWSLEDSHRNKYLAQQPAHISAQRACAFHVTTAANGMNSSIDPRQGPTRRLIGAKNDSWGHCSANIATADLGCAQNLHGMLSLVMTALISALVICT